jgi:hypothetical protein
MLNLPVVVRAQIVLALEAVAFIGGAVAFYLIKRRPRPLRPWHCRGMALAFAVKTLGFLFGMAPIFAREAGTLPPTFGLASTRVLVLHVLVGVVSLVFGWWVVLALQFKLSLPKRQTPRSLHNIMVWTAITWAAGFVLGGAVYWLWYVA